MIDEFLDEVSRYADQFDYLASAKIALSLSDTATNVEVVFTIGSEEPDAKRLLDAVSDTLKRRGWKIDVYVELPAGRAGWIQMRRAGVQA